MDLDVVLDSSYGPRRTFEDLSFYNLTIRALLPVVGFRNCKPCLKFGRGDGPVSLFSLSRCCAQDRTARSPLPNLFELGAFHVALSLDDGHLLYLVRAVSTLQMGLRT